MANHTMLSKKDIEKLIARYAIGDVFDFSIIEGGAGNSSFKVETNEGQFVLTICDEKKYADIQNLINLLDHLEQEDFPTTRSVHSKTRGPITFYHRTPVFLKRFIQGDVVDNVIDDAIEGEAVGECD